VVVAATALGRPRPGSAAPRILQWGSASLGSTGYVIIEALAATVNKHTKLRNSSMSTAGGAENMALIGEGLLDFGQSTSADWPPALKGEAPFKQPIKAVQMFSYTVWSVAPMVLAGSPIRRLEDLAGRRVSPGPAGGSTAFLWKTLFQEAGLYDRIRWTYGSWRESYDALKSGAIDCTATLLTSGRPAPIMIELETAHRVRLLDVPPEILARARRINPGIMAFEATPERWKSLERPVQTPAFSGILAAHPRVDAETGYTVTQAIYDHAAEVQKISIELQDIRLDFATKYLIEGVPVNAGAARYFREKGVWRNELTIG